MNYRTQLSVKMFLSHLLASEKTVDLLKNSPFLTSLQTRVRSGFEFLKCSLLKRFCGFGMIFAVNITPDLCFFHKYEYELFPLFDFPANALFFG